MYVCMYVCVHQVAHLRYLTTARGSRLLVSGWWGAARKINYTGRIYICICIYIYIYVYIYRERGREQITVSHIPV
jgi:hypothetical protein